MRIDGSLPPTNPYHIARAYGLQSAPIASAAKPAPSVQTARATDGAEATLPSAAQRLVAAVVPGRVDFSGETARPGAAALAMYRHPADKNAAATGVMLGRSLDVSG